MKRLKKDKERKKQKKIKQEKKKTRKQCWIPKTKIEMKNVKLNA